MVSANLIVGITIIIINLLPILLKKYNLLIITGAISVMLGILLMTEII